MARCGNWKCPRRYKRFEATSHQNIIRHTYIAAVLKLLYSTEPWRNTFRKRGPLYQCTRTLCVLISLLLRTYPSFIIFDLTRIVEGPFKFFALRPNFYTYTTKPLIPKPNNEIPVLRYTSINKLRVIDYDVMFITSVILLNNVHLYNIYILC